MPRPSPANYIPRPSPANYIPLAAPADYIPLTPRPSPADYIPLAAPARRAPWSAAAHSLSAYLRRRALFAGITAAALVLLYFLLRFHIQDLDDLDLDADPDALLDDPPDFLLAPDFLLDPGDPDSPARTAYLPLHLSDAPAPQPTLEPVTGVPPACLEPLFARGEPCFAPPAPLDLVWTWVNGSDPLLEHEKARAAAAYAPDDPDRPLTTKTQARQFRDHDELRHSLRSALAAFRPHTRRLHLLTADFPVPATEPNLTLAPAPAAATDWRLGQVPQWLALGAREGGEDSWRDGDVALEVTHHAEVFAPYVGTSFNSLAIESQLAHLPGVSENFVYMNDDVYFARALTPATFYTAAYGTVLHLQPTLLVSPSPPTRQTTGEWRALQHTNARLSARFGPRARPYVLHASKALSRPLLRELSAVFAEQLGATARHRFRERTGGPGAEEDFNAVWASAQFVVERAREALLWAWAVARVGGVDGAWAEEEARRAWEELGGVWDAEAREGEATIEVRAGWRETLEGARVDAGLGAAGVERGAAGVERGAAGVERGATGVERGVTGYSFSSLDGYAFATLGAHGAQRFPAFTPGSPEAGLPRCTLAYAACFVAPPSPDSPSPDSPSPGFASAAAFFAHVAFRNAPCGDCIITALVKASGPRGLAAFLPDPSRVLPPSDPSPSRPYPPPPPPERAGDEAESGEEVAPHLPLVPDWRDGDFSLGAVMRASGARDGARVRAFAAGLLARYRYVVGETPAVFERLQTPSQVRALLGRLDRDPQAALVCLNDDVSAGDAEVGALMRAWQGKRWPVKAGWER